MSGIKNREKFSISKYRIIVFLIFFISCLYVFFNSYKNDLFSYSNEYIQAKSEMYGYTLKDIEITGINNVKKNEIIDLISNNYNKSVFLISLKEVKRELLKHPWIEDFNIKIDYPSSFNIDIKEKIPIAIFKSKDNKYFFIDSSGNRIKELISPQEQNLMIYEGDGADISILDLIENLNFYENLEIKFAEYIGRRRWDLINNKMLKIKLPENNYKLAIKDISNLINKLDEFDYNLVEFIDLRIEKKIVIRFYDKSDIELVESELK